MQESCCKEKKKSTAIREIAITIKIREIEKKAKKPKSNHYIRYTLAENTSLRLEEDFF